MFTGYTIPQREDLWASFRVFMLFGAIMAVITSLASLVMSATSLYYNWFAVIPSDTLRAIMSCLLSLVFEGVTHLSIFYIAFSFYERKKVKENDKMNSEEKKIRLQTYNGNIFIYAIMAVLFVGMNGYCNYEGSIIQLKNNFPPPVKQNVDLAEYEAKMEEAKVLKEKLESDAISELGNGHITSINELKRKINKANSANKGYKKNHPKRNEYKKGDLHYWVLGSINKNNKDISLCESEIGRIQANYEAALSLSIASTENQYKDVEELAKNIKSTAISKNNKGYDDSSTEYESDMDYYSIIVICFCLLFVSSDSFFHFFFQRANYLSGRKREIVSNPHDHSQPFLSRLFTYLSIQCSNLGDRLLDFIGASEMSVSHKKGAIAVHNTDTDEDTGNSPDDSHPTGSDETRKGELLTEESLTGKLLTDKMLTGKPLTDKVLTGKVLTGESLTDKMLTGKSLTGKVITEKPLTEKLSVSQIVMEENEGEDAHRLSIAHRKDELTENRSQEKIFTENHSQQKIFIGNSIKDFVDFHVNNSKYCPEENMREEAMQWISKTPDFYYKSNNINNWYRRKNSTPKISSKTKQPSIKSLRSIEMSAMKYDIAKFICESSGQYRVEGFTVKKVAI